MNSDRICQLLYDFKAPALFRLLMRSRVVVLSYHRVVPFQDMDALQPGMIVPPEMFKMQMEYLKKYYSVISLEELIEKLPKNELQPYTAVITFDDGYYDNYEYAYPVLKEMDFPATIFIPTGFIESGLSFFWDEVAYMIFNTRRESFQLRLGSELVMYDLSRKDRVVWQLCSRVKRFSQLEQDIILDALSTTLGVLRNRSVSKLLTWSLMRDMKQHKIAFGAHTHLHGAVSVGGIGEILKDVKISKDILDKQLKQNTVSFAYPFGDKTDISLEVSQSLPALGIKGAVTLESGLVRYNHDPYLLKRIGVGQMDEISRFSLKVCGLLTWLSHIKQRLHGR
ncbi:MAG: polysaccharide deacetylase family protein [Candidatus Omnitrophica bacterium]|nr:polysaccharide deacetylase family protein [Candidatus Omnitrophota bacterium]